VAMSAGQRQLAEVRETVLALAGEIAVVAAEQVGPAAEASVREVADTVRRQSYSVVVCGEFKLGKSSLLNAIIGQRQLFPTGDTLTTATLMMLRWGPQARAIARIRTPDGEIEEEVEFDDLARYVSTTSDGEAYRVERVDVRLPDPRLESGVVLVDTPGVGGVDEVHSAVTEEQLVEADALVLSAIRPASLSELAFARRAFATKPATVVALTMADKVVDIAGRVDRARDRLATYLGVRGDDLTVLPVSSTEAWAARLTGDEARLLASGLPELERRIWTTLLTQAVARRLRGAVNALLGRLAEASAPIASELTALGGKANLEQVLAELDETERAAIAAGHDLADEGDFEKEFTVRVDGTEQRFLGRIDRVIAQVRAITADDATPPTVQQLAALARTAATASPQGFRELKEGVSAVAESWEARIRHPLRVLDLSPRDGLAVPTPPQPVRERPEFSATVAEGAKAAGATGPVVTLFATAIGMVFGPAGAVYGALTGAVAGLASFFGGVLDQVRRANAHAQERQIRQYREQVLVSLEDHRSNTLSLLEQTRQSLLQNLKLQLRTLNRSELEAIDKSRQRVLESARVAADRKAARTEALNHQREMIAAHAASLYAVVRTLAEIEAGGEP
jgi:hypothetical protein